MFLLIFLLVVAVFAVMVLILSSRPRPSKMAGDARSGSETFEGERREAGGDTAVPAAEELVGELHRLSDKIATSVQGRVSELSALLDRADEKIAELNTSVKEPPTGASETSEGNNRPETPIPERYRAVYGLADDGLDVYEIARRMKIGAGEIELILSLRDKG